MIHISWHSDCHIIDGFGWMEIFRILFWDHWSAAVQTLSWHISPKVAWSFSARRVKKQKTPISRPWRRCFGKMMDVSSCGHTSKLHLGPLGGLKGVPWPSKLKLFETKPLDFASFAILWTHSGVIDAGHSLRHRHVHTFWQHDFCVFFGGYQWQLNCKRDPSDRVSYRVVLGGKFF